MRTFSFSEAYGPFPCEGKLATKGACAEQAWDVLLTDEENEALPENAGPIAAKHILQGGIGKMLCEDCLDEEQYGP